MKKSNEKSLFKRATEHLQFLLQSHHLQGKKIIIALSGGADSIFLGMLLSTEIPAELLLAAHFDHQLRNSSKEDELFCKTWAKEKNIRFFSERWNTPKNTEEAARNARREFLFSIAKQENVSSIALGTHANDNVETIFHHFLRGTGAKGLSGISEFDEKTTLFRPLLPFWKIEILSFLAQEKIPFCEDETNASSEYTRNFLRNDVFPLLRTRFPEYENNILRQAEVFRRQHYFCEQSAKKFLEKQEEKISRKEFSQLPEAVQTEIVRFLFAPGNIDFAQTESLREFFLTGKSGKKMILGDTQFSTFSEYIFWEKSS